MKPNKRRRVIGFLNPRFAKCRDEIHPRIHCPWLRRYTRYPVLVYLVLLDVMWMKKVRKRKAEAKAGRSAKPHAIVLAALELFTRFVYRKTSIDDIAEAAQVAKRKVYLHFENKAAVFLAILEYLGNQLRQRCGAAERMGGTAVDRLAGLLDAYLEWGSSSSANLSTCRSWRRLS